MHTCSRHSYVAVDVDIDVHIVVDVFVGAGVLVVVLVPAVGVVVVELAIHNGSSVAIPPVSVDMRNEQIVLPCSCRGL